jgi:hypothetical protein
MIGRRSTITLHWQAGSYSARTTPLTNAKGRSFCNREGHKQSGDPMKAALDSAQRIATDDPRLKEK